MVLQRYRDARHRNIARGVVNVIIQKKSLTMLFKLPILSLSPWEGTKLIQEQFNHCPLSVVAESGGLGTSRPCVPVFINTLVGSGTGSLGMAPSNSSTPPTNYLAGTLVELRFLVAGVSQAGNT